MLNKSIKLILMLLLLAFSFFVYGCTSPAKTILEKPAGSITPLIDIYTLDVGHGDAHLIKVGEEFTLIDSGDVEHRDTIVRLLKKYKVKALKNVIITHPHTDHLGGMYAIFQQFPIDALYDNGRAYPSTAYKTYMKQMSLKGLERKVSRVGDSIDLGQGVSLKVFAPTDTVHLLANGKFDANNDSIVAKLVYKDFSMLFTGDAESIEEEEILRSYKKELASTILKVGHHGSKTSSTEAFVKAVNPEAAVISVALADDYKHPHPKTIELLKKHKIKVYRTDEDGTIHIATDGINWTAEVER